MLKYSTLYKIYTTPPNKQIINFLYQYFKLPVEIFNAIACLIILQLIIKAQLFSKLYRIFYLALLLDKLM